MSTRTTRFLIGLASLLLVLDALFGLFIVVGSFWGVGPDGRSVGVHTTVPTSQLEGLPRNAVTPDQLTVLVRVEHASREQIRWAAGRDLPLAMIVVAALWLLRQLLASVRDGDPFIRRNVARLRMLAMLIIVGVPVTRLMSSYSEGHLATSAGLHGRGLAISVPGEVLVAGLVVVVLSEVFAAGSRMRDDLEGTV